ncbi:site-2 protease family protein [Methanolobus bombayensis]|uniref:site-2 protease family protein n=1 Tax=Methanolobus bombayensis TaxID=38023 RepID=UPI001AEB6428|nr:site-2 protease family protein [Methanolobus bombayensis]MBP1908997.1 Zn-dependent protease [Methanolobus bombayensis]
MNNAYRIGTIIGIPIKVDISFLIVLPLFAWFFSSQAEPFGFAGTQSETMKYILSLLTAILLFASVLIHELAHSYFTLRYGGSIKEIRLHLLGGVAAMKEEVHEPLKVMTIVAAGPLSSIIMGVLLLIFNYSFNPVSVSEGNALFLIAFILGYINIFLGFFNLVPAFPMDGGRILRAFLSTRMDFVKATEKAVLVGKIFAVLMGILGLFTDFWLLLIAFYIYGNASREEQLVKSRYTRY